MEQVMVAGQAAPKKRQRKDTGTAIIPLLGLIGQSGANASRFCAYLKIQRLDDLEASRFDPACQALRRKLGSPPRVAP